MLIMIATRRVMAPNFAIYLFFLSGSMSSILCAKILVVGSAGGSKSHYLVMNAIAQELSSRGHEVIFPYPSCITFAQNNPLVAPYDLPEDLCLKVNGTNPTPVSNIITTLTFVVQRTMSSCEAFMNSPVFKEIKDVDIQVGENFTPCSSITAAYLDIPYVEVFTSGLNLPFMTKWTPSSFSALSYVPYFQSRNPSTGLNFFQRVTNVLSYFGSNLLLNTLIFEPTANAFMEDMGILPGKKFKDISTNAALVLINGDFVFEEAQPVPPGDFSKIISQSERKEVLSNIAYNLDKNVKLVGPVLVKPAKPLPAKFEEFMQSSGDDGVIVVSFGAMDRESSSIDLQEGLAEAFSKLPYKVLWKTKDNSSLTLSKNVRTFSWIPQNDILGHPKTKLYVTHCGQNSIYEAIYHGIPMVSVPFVADQPDNSRRLVSHGISKEVDYTRNKEEIVEQMVDAVTKVLNDPGYKQRMLHLSRVLKSHRRTPVQEACDWIEHVHQLKDMSHLKPHGNKLYFYQRYLLDVFVFFSIILAVVCYTFKVFIMVIVKCCKKKRGKDEKTKYQ